MVRMRLAVAMAVHVVVLVVLPVVMDGLVVVVHVCFHVFVFPVKVVCSGSRISCGVRVVRFGLVLRRMAESWREVTGSNLGNADIRCRALYRLHKISVLCYMLAVSEPIVVFVIGEHNGVFSIMLWFFRMSGHQP